MQQQHVSQVDFGSFMIIIFNWVRNCLGTFFFSVLCVCCLGDFLFIKETQNRYIHNHIYLMHDSMSIYNYNILYHINPFLFINIIFPSSQSLVFLPSFFCRCSAGDFDVELGLLQCFYQPQDGSDQR